MEDILQSFQLTKNEQKSYAMVRDQVLVGFREEEKHSLRTVYRFNLRQQEEGESAASFISNVYVLSEYCGYWDLHDEIDLRQTGSRHSQ